MEREANEKYRAPALDKGLDILELLSEQSDGLTRTEIVKAMGRGPSEIYRMLERLVARGYAPRLQNAAKALQYPFGMLPAALGGIAEGRAGRCRAAPRPIITSERPEVSGLDFWCSRIENRRAGFICYPAGVCEANDREGMNSFVDRFRSAIRASNTGRNSKAARPTQSARVERSRSTP